MAGDISLRLLEFLEWRGVDYEILAHPPTGDALHTAEAAHVPGDRLAKAVILKDAQGYVMAVLPATHHVDLEALRALLGRPLAFAREEELPALFQDCAPGAIPPLGPAYGLEMVVDEALSDDPEIYFEAGDHRDLVRVDAADFAALIEGARRGRFSRHLGH